MDKSTETEIRKLELQILPQTLTSCIILGMFFKVFPQFPHLEDENDNI